MFCQAQVLHPHRSTTYTAAVTYSRLQADAFSFRNNPAALTWLQKPVFGFTGEQPYLLPDLTSGAFSAVLPMGSSRFGFLLEHAGGRQQHQSGGSLSFAQVLGKKASLGASFHYQSLGVAGYGAFGMPGVGLGGCLLLTSELQAGFRLFRGIGNIGGINGERLAAKYDFGLGYDLSPEFFFSAVLSANEGVPPEVQAACSYRFSGKLHSRLGVHTGTGLFFVGGGFKMGELQIDAFTSLHPRLGFSPGLQVSFKPAERK
jgi:hypothetical protein